MGIEIMRSLFGVLVALSLSLWVSSANAVFTFSNVTYTANSVTFTIDGDMSGYTNDDYLNQFSLVYGGDIWVGDATFEPNTWSRPVFDNKSFSSGGNTGTSGNSYTWSAYATNLNDAVVSNATVTVTLTEPDLNEAASSPQISFVWGNGNNEGDYILLGTGGSTAAPATPVPTLSQWALIMLSMLLGLMVFVNRRRLF